MICSKCKLYSSFKDCKSYTIESRPLTRAENKKYEKESRAYEKKMKAYEKESKAFDDMKGNNFTMHPRDKVMNFPLLILPTLNTKIIIYCTFS